MLNCVTCHNPHAGVVELRQAKSQITQVNCQDCHYQEAQYQKNSKHVSMGLSCTQCHMSQIIKLAWGEVTRYTGDLRTHAVAIHSTQVEQFFIENAEDGTEQAYSKPQVGLNFACRQCHNSAGGFPKSDQELIDGAYGYHDQPAEPPVLPTQTPTPAP